MLMTKLTLFKYIVVVMIKVMLMKVALQCNSQKD